jgi:hypothetical protein
MFRYIEQGLEPFQKSLRSIDGTRIDWPLKEYQMAKIDHPVWL